jgi:hypothetical protein
MSGTIECISFTTFFIIISFATVKMFQSKTLRVHTKGCIHQFMPFSINKNVVNYNNITIHGCDIKTKSVIRKTVKLLKK